MKTFLTGIFLSLGGLVLTPALAGPTHLGVSSTKITKLTYQGLTNSDINLYPWWGEYVNGIRSARTGGTFTVPPGRTLVITDLEAVIRCITPDAGVQVRHFAPQVLDPSNKPLTPLYDFYATFREAGVEKQHISLTSGMVLPGGYTISVKPQDPAVAQPYVLEWLFIYGYYAD